MPYQPPTRNNPLMLLVLLIAVAQAAEDEMCGLQGSSTEGYCRCTAPAGHWPDTSHRCQHGAWD